MREPGCSSTIAQCKSNMETGLPAQMFQGMPVHYKYNLASDVTEHYKDGVEMTSFGEVTQEKNKPLYCTSSTRTWTDKRPCNCSQGSMP
jgi:hypothetical protein